MSVFSLVGIVTTVLSFLIFVGIVVWAYGRGRRNSFDEAANAPFALPDDVDETSATTSKSAAMSAAAPSQGANSSPSGGSAAAPAASVGVHR